MGMLACSGPALCVVIAMVVAVVCGAASVYPPHSLQLQQPSCSTPSCSAPADAALLQQMLADSLASQVAPKAPRLGDIAQTSCRNTHYKKYKGCCYYCAVTVQACPKWGAQRHLGSSRRWKFQRLSTAIPLWQRLSRAIH